jgi:hypothetical protein
VSTPTDIIFLAIAQSTRCLLESLDNLIEVHGIAL